MNIDDTREIVLINGYEVEMEKWPDGYTAYESSDRIKVFARTREEAIREMEILLSW